MDNWLLVPTTAPCDVGANAMDPWNDPPATKRKAFVATEDNFMIDFY